MKRKLCAIALILVLTLCSCSGGEKQESSSSGPTVSELSEKITGLEKEIASLTEENTQLKEKISTMESDAQKKKAAANPEKPLSLSDEWVVDGQWKLKINSVTVTEDRNQFSDSNPAEVVIIDYTYENIGYKKNIQDLYLMPDQVIDGKNELAQTYPVLVDGPQPTPIGAKCANAQVAFGLKNPSSKIKVVFSQHGNNLEAFSATFEVPVTK